MSSSETETFTETSTPTVRTPDGQPSSKKAPTSFHSPTTILPIILPPKSTSAASPSTPSSSQPPDMPSTTGPLPTLTSYTYASSSTQVASSSYITVAASGSSSNQVPAQTTKPEVATPAPVTTMAVTTEEAIDDDNPYLATGCLTRTDRSCVFVMTYGDSDVTTAYPLGQPYYATIVMTTFSGIVEPVTTLSARPSFSAPAPTPTNSNPMIVVPTTVTDSQGAPVATLDVGAQVVPTFSVITDIEGSVTTAPYNLTTPFSVEPSTLYTLTAWRTYTVLNGLTISLAAKQTVIISTTRFTYAFMPGTTVLVNQLSSIRAESTRTSLPSATTGTAQVGSSKSNKIAGATIGTILGLVLLVVSTWILVVRRRGWRTPDYAATKSLIWGTVPGSVEGSRSNDRLTLDLGSEPQPRASFVEPWVEKVQPQPRDRKLQRGTEGLREGFMATALSQTATRSPIGHNQHNIQSSDLANQLPLEQHPQLSSRLDNTLTSTHPFQESGSASIQQLLGTSSPTLMQPSFIITQSPPPLTQQRVLVPAQPRIDGEPTEAIQHNVVPPVYNEAWNIRRVPPSE